MNITDYAYCQDTSFEEKKLNKVDSLVFSQFSYYNFESLLECYSSQGKNLYIKDIALPENLPFLFESLKMNKEKVNFCYALAQSSRFRDIEIVNQINVLARDKNKQFSATTFLINQNYIYIAFRGTEPTIVGWKEDFSLAYSKNMPSQEDALNYLDKILKIYSEQLVYVGGHSKGGNLAIFASVFCKQKDRIVGVFNHDGPGFRKEFFLEQGYLDIKDRIICLLPECSIVGIIWNSGYDYEVVLSKSSGVFQHNPFSWLIKADDFVYCDKLSDFSENYKQAMSDWLYNTSNRKKESFFNAIINIFEKTGSEDFLVIFKNLPKNLPVIFAEIRHLDEETKEMLSWTLKKTFEIYIRTTPIVKASNDFVVKINKFGEKLKMIKSKDNKAENAINIEGEKSVEDETIEIAAEIIDDSKKV